MNQRETINLLNSIMPDIISSKDPEGTMLKCAEAHNLSPAQLEKLGQTFNTAKTIVGLEKQANRGDSFKIVDVPSLITKYATYSPDKAISRRSQKVHDKVDRLFDDEDGWSACITISKSASEKASLPDLNSIVSDMFGKMNSGFVDSTEEEVYDLSKNPAWTWEKSAGARESEVYSSVTGDLRLAKEAAEQLMFEIPLDITEKCASIASKLTPDEGRWAEVAEDIYYGFGEKAASVIATIENYFANANHHFEQHADFSKQACHQQLVQDRYDVFEEVKDIIELSELLKKATAVTLDDAIRKSLEDDGFSVDEDGDVAINPETIKDFNTSGKGKKSRNAEDITFEDKSTKDKREKENLPPAELPTEVIKPGEDLNALIDAMSPAVKNIPALGDAMNTKPIDSLEDILRRIGPRSDSRAKTIDTALRQAQMDTTLQQLMLSDDVIADSDPNEVQSLFKTLASISPSLATDPGKMGPALKEALQYGAVPINILTDAAKLEGQLAKTELDRANAERNKYSL